MGKRLVFVVGELVGPFGVKYIGICQVIRRKNESDCQFNLKVTKLHLYLRAVLEPLPYCLYWKHSFFLEYAL